jgi:hypothetical protein
MWYAVGAVSLAYVSIGGLGQGTTPSVLDACASRKRRRDWICNV